MQYVNGSDLDLSGPIDTLPEMFLFDTVLDPTVPLMTSVDQLVTYGHLARALLGPDGRTTNFAGYEGYAKYFTNFKYVFEETDERTYKGTMLKSSGKLAVYDDYSLGKGQNLVKFLVPSWEQPFLINQNTGAGSMSMGVYHEVVSNTIGATTAISTACINKNGYAVAGSFSNFGYSKRAVGTVIDADFDVRVSYPTMPATKITPTIFFYPDSLTRSGGIKDPPAGTPQGARPVNMYNGTGTGSNRTESIVPNLLVIPKGERCYSFSAKEFSVNNGLPCKAGLRYPYALAANVQSFNLSL